MSPDILALLIPVVFIIIGGLVAVVAMIYRFEEKKKIFDERKFAMDKGLPVPPMVLKDKNPILADKIAVIVNRKAFVILLFIGIAFMVISPDGNDEQAGRFVGLVLILLSFAMLINSFIRLKLTSDEKQILNRDFGGKNTVNGDEEQRK